MDDLTLRVSELVAAKDIDIPGIQTDGDYPYSTEERKKMSDEMENILTPLLQYLSTCTVPQEQHNYFQVLLERSGNIRLSRLSLWVLNASELKGWRIAWRGRHICARSTLSFMKVKRDNFCATSASCRARKW
jgi:hypothetical protein